MKGRLLRGHHLLCVHGFRGMGYSPDFVRKMGDIVEEIKDEEYDFPIKVVIGLDETCSVCPHKGEDFCNKDEDSQAHVIQLDTRVTNHLGLEHGKSYSKNEIVSLVGKEVQPSDLDYLCEGCSWLSYGVCKEGISQLNIQYRRSQS
ncbi:DUF1284 domain-containing protein [Bacillus salitolerans]|uniref:DUF1284 domain-containing protein n=1 Tax=Bacillus salitolerans TaxID=1437434 RepID=A0ABW4LRT7_9BACI